MAEDLCQVMVIGRLVRDIDIKYTSGGMAIGSMSIACNRRKKQGDQWTEEANFFDVTMFGNRAVSLDPYLKKGQQIAVEGSLKQDRWEQDGVKRSRIQIIANNLQLLGGQRDNAGGGQQQSQPFESYAPPQETYNGNEDDIPF